MIKQAVLVSVMVAAGALTTVAAPPAGDPDLIVVQQTLSSSWTVEERFFAPDDCAIVEGCVGGAGYRRLLRFATQTANVVPDDLHLGSPNGDPLFVWSPCHGHYHFQDYADYELLDQDGSLAAPGHKQAFCVEDTNRYLNDRWVAKNPRYTCSDQGIQGGWSDVYSSELDCQWVDVTGVQDGQYVLSVTVNPGRILPELSYANNTAAVGVDISEPAGIPHRPDGHRIPGVPLRAAPAGAMVRITYDASFCPPAIYNVFYGLQHPPSTYTYDGQICGVGPSGDADVSFPEPPPGGLVWFLIVGRDGVGREGGHGFASDGSLRPLTGFGRCGVFQSIPGTCGL